MNPKPLASALTILLLGLAPVAAAMIPGQQQTASSPPASTPPVASEPYHVDAITAPATCTANPCSTGSHVDPVTTPSQCVPLVFITPCVDELTLLTEKDVPAICATALAPTACRPATEVVPAQDGATPGMGSMSLLPEGFVQADVATFDSDARAPDPVMGSRGPTQVLDVGPIHLTACSPQPCPDPQLDNGFVYSGFYIRIQIAGEEVEHAQPIYQAIDTIP